MPRKPKATSRKAKTAGASIRAEIEVLAALTQDATNIEGLVALPKYAMVISAPMLKPIQKALKLPATNPDRMFSDAPPSREDVTTSLTWLDSTDVNTLTSSGMMAPASVPHVMMVDSLHESVPSPRSPMSSLDTMYVRTTEIIDVSHTSWVSGASKFIFVTSR